MLSARAVKRWYLVHKWTSLICTAFLLLLCATGLPLIFYHELDHLLGEAVEAPAMAPGTPKAPLDQVVAAGTARYPHEFVQFVSWDPDEPDLVFLSLARARDAPPDDNRLIVVDARTANVLGEPQQQEGLLDVLFRLHTDLFAGLPGMLFLGLMGLLFVAAVVSGVAVYGPFMRRLDFGTVRGGKSTRLKWLDLHNLLGIVILTWTLVVGVTGVINTWADLLLALWRSDQLASMVAPYEGKPPLLDPVSLDRAVATAQAAAPDMTPGVVAFPGSSFSSEHHYAVFMHGNTPLTSRLFKPVLIDAGTATLTERRDLPWYLTMLELSQPLHFGDYGGMPMKIIWALLDLVTIVVLASGLYLWLARRRMPIESRLAELARAETGAGADDTPAVRR